MFYTTTYTIDLHLIISVREHCIEEEHDTIDDRHGSLGHSQIPRSRPEGFLPGLDNEHSGGNEEAAADYAVEDVEPFVDRGTD